MKVPTNGYGPIAAAMQSDPRVSRKLIATTPVLLVGGIIAQVILLVAAILFFVPLMIWPEILNRPYLIITRAMGRMMARSIVGKKSRPKAGVIAELVIIPLSDTPVSVPPDRRVSMLRW